MLREMDSDTSRAARLDQCLGMRLIGRRQRPAGRSKDPTRRWVRLAADRPQRLLGTRSRAARTPRGGHAETDRATTGRDRR